MVAERRALNPREGKSPQAEHRLLFKLAALVERMPWMMPALDITEIDVPIAGLAPDLEGFTIAQISDLHVAGGPWVPLRLEEAVQAVHGAAPDIVVNTGDFLQWEPPADKAVAAASPFVIGAKENLSGPVNFAVMGNHDHYAGEDAVADLTDALTRAGICVLTNELTTVSRGRASITLVGLSLESEGFAEAVDAMLESHRPRVVLAHAAEIAERLPTGSADLILSGHTHGGQIALPFLTPFIIRKFNGSHFGEGRYRVNGNPLYINRGLGCTGLPLRFRAAPEVTVLRLVR